MNTLQELNDYGDEGVSATDERDALVKVQPFTPNYNFSSVNQDATFTSAALIDILEIIDYEQCDTRIIFYFDDTAGALSFPDLPAGVTVTYVPSDGSTLPTTGEWTVGPITSIDEWNAVKEPVINLTVDYYGDADFTGEIWYTDQDDQDQLAGYWNNFYTVAENFGLTKTTTFEIVPDDLGPIVGYPQIIENTAATFTVVITSSDTTRLPLIASTGSGGTFTYSSGANTITIVGTRTQVNTRLSTLTFDADSSEFEFVLTYTLTNTLTAITNTRTHPSIIRSELYLSNPLATYYNEFEAYSVTDAPNITNITYEADGSTIAATDGTGPYTLEITATTGSVTTMSSGGSGGSSSWSSGNKKLTITGTRTQVNSHLNALTISPAQYYDQTFYVFYKLTTNGGHVNIKTQQQTISHIINEVVGLNVSRTYLSNQSNKIFAIVYGADGSTIINPTPQIDDESSDSTQYVIQFIATAGYFVSPDDINNYSTSITLSGTRLSINNKIVDIEYCPVYAQTTNTSFTYKQYRDGSQQVNQIVDLTYAGAGAIDVAVIDVSNGGYGYFEHSVIPKYQLYANVDILVAGAGGSGGCHQNGGGGGGGGGVYVLSDHPLSVNQSRIGFQIGSGTTGPYDGLGSRLGSTDYPLIIKSPIAISTTQSKFGGSSIKFTNQGSIFPYIYGFYNDQYLTVDYNSVWDLAQNTNWTCEFWLRPDQMAGATLISQIDLTTGLGWMLRCDDSQLVFFDEVGDNDHGCAGFGVNTPSAGSWSHIAIVRTGSNLKIFHNGIIVLNDTSYVAASTNAGPLRIGYGLSVSGGVYSESSYDGYNGYMDEIRISTSARYSTTFTPSASAFTSDSDTALLIHANDTNGSQTFIDSSTASTKTISIPNVNRIYNFNYTEWFGGTKGQSIERSAGGASGSPTAHAGGTGSSANYYMGGGGGGAGTAGANGPTSGGVNTGAAGGAGYLWNGIYFGGGGGGGGPSAANSPGGQGGGGRGGNNVVGNKPTQGTDGLGGGGGGMYGGITKNVGGTPSVVTYYRGGHGTARIKYKPRT